MRRRIAGRRDAIGRPARRDLLLAGLDIARAAGLEIGPLDKPLVRKDEGEIVYVDRLATDHLRNRYKNDPGVSIGDIVPVDAVWQDRTLADAVGTGRRFDYVVASHVLERVPDPVSWLQEIRAVLKSDGSLRLAVPDKRFTFDYDRDPARLADVLDAYLRKAKVPLPRAILDFCLSARRVDAAAAWRGPLMASTLPRHHTDENAILLAKDALANGTYHDIHCWAFTPASFAALMARLGELDLLDFACRSLVATRKNDIEFLVTMTPGSGQGEIVDSWRRAADPGAAAQPRRLPRRSRADGTAAAGTRPGLNRLDKRRPWQRRRDTILDGWRGRRAHDKIFFLHIPKTAGTAFNRSFAASVPDGRLFEHMEIRRDRFAEVQRDGLPFFLSGHFTFAETRDLIERDDVFALTILRDPAAQFLSHLRMVKFVGSPDYGYPVEHSLLALAKELWQTPFSDVGALAALVDSVVGRRLFDNLQVRYLTAMTDDFVGERQADEAIRNLARFDLVLTLEQLRSAEPLLVREFPDLLEMESSNIARIIEGLDETDAAAAALIEKCTRHDRRLYAAAHAAVLGRLSRAQAFGGRLLGRS